MSCKTGSIFAALFVRNEAEAHQLTPWNTVDILYLGHCKTSKSCLIIHTVYFLLILCACAACLPSEAPWECVICLTSLGQYSLLPKKCLWSHFCSVLRHWFGFFHQIFAFSCTVNKPLINKAGFVFQMFSFVLNCVCAPTTNARLCASFLCARVHKRRRSELFLFLYIFLATSPFLVLCPPTQNGAILSPSVPEMKYKPLKCILILPCRLRLKNKHTHTHTCLHAHTH